MYSIHNEGKSVAAERLIRKLKNKIYKYVTAIPNNVYKDKLDDIVDEYNDIYHRTIKMKLVDVKENTYIDFEKEVMIMILNLKFVIMLEFLNKKIFLLKDICQIGLKKFLLSVKLKIQFHGRILLMILIAKKLLDHFIKKICKILIKKNLE